MSSRKSLREHALDERIEARMFPFDARPHTVARALLMDILLQAFATPLENCFERRHLPA